MLIGVVAAVIGFVGLTRVALGVHYVSDVLGGWLLGAAWLGVTAYAFRLWRREAGQPVSPLRDGLEPEAAEQLAPAPREHHVLPRPLVGTAEILTGWVLLFGLLYVVGMLITRYADGTVVRDFDLAVVRWLAERRTPALDDLSYLWSKAGDTHAILLVSLVFCPLLLAVWRRWRPVLFLALTMIGELTLFLATAAAVDRPRPPVEQLDGRPADLGLPVRPHRRHHLPLRGDRGPGPAAYPPVVAVAGGGAGGAHAGRGGAVADVPRHAPPDRPARRCAAHRGLDRAAGLGGAAQRPRRRDRGRRASRLRCRAAGSARAGRGGSGTELSRRSPRFTYAVIS